MNKQQKETAALLKVIRHNDTKIRKKIAKITKHLAAIGVDTTELNASIGVYETIINRVEDLAYFLDEKSNGDPRGDESLKQGRRDLTAAVKCRMAEISALKIK